MKALTSLKTVPLCRIKHTLSIPFRKIIKVSLSCFALLTSLLFFTYGSSAEAYTNEYLPRKSILQKSLTDEIRSVEAATTKIDPLSYEWRVEGYRPNYFIYGNPDAKVSLSLKVPILNTSNLYLAYSQIMFWELQKDSTPFRDINYNPEIFYRQHFDVAKSHWIDYGIYEHESNGRDGIYSRSWERNYIRYVREFDNDRKPIIMSLKGWINAIRDPMNRDIKNYRGIYEVNVTVKNVLNIYEGTSDLNFRIYPGGPSQVDPTKGGQELTLRASMPYFTNFRPLLLMQVFNGYGEGLLDYKTRHTVYRIGFGF